MRRLVTRVGVAVLLSLAAGCRTPAYVTVSGASAGAYEASLAAFGDGFVVAWYDTREGQPQLYARMLDARGQPDGPERRLESGPDAAYEADVQALDDGLAVGWYDKSPDGHVTPRLGAWARDGRSRWTRTLAATGRNTVIRAGGGLIFAAWIQDDRADQSGVWGGWWRDDGQALIPPRRLADASRTTWNLNAALDPGSSPGHPRAWVVFDATRGTARSEVFVVEAGELATHVTRLTADDGVPSTYPDIGFSRDRVALTWFDRQDGQAEVYVAFGDRAMLAGSAAAAPRRVTTTPGDSIGAYLAWNGDRLGLAWCDDTGGQHEIYFRRFDAHGTPVGDVRRITRTSASSLIPAIVAWRDGFALAWNEYEPAGGATHDGGRSRIAFTLVP